MSTREEAAAKAAHGHDYGHVPSYTWEKATEELRSDYISCEISALAAADAHDAANGIHRVKGLDGLLVALTAREDRWKKAYEAGEMSHEEASSAAREDRWLYGCIREIQHAMEGSGE